jgi:hypothetical protein
MYNKPLSTLSTVIALGMRVAAKLLLGASLLAVSGAAAMPTSRPFSYSIHGATVVRRSELGPLTGTEAYSLTTTRPDQELGPVRYASNLDIFQPPTLRTFTYSLFNGNVVVRRSELGPLTGTLDNFTRIPGPGHDFGVIGGVAFFESNQPAAASPFTYTLPNGNVVVRRSELGPLTETVDNSLQILAMDK